MIATEPRLARALVVFVGPHGEVPRYARERGVRRPWVYRQAHTVAATLQENPAQQEIARRHAQLRQREQQLAALEQRLAQAVVLDADQQAEFATVGQARGVRLPDCRELLEELRPGHVLSVAPLGRRTQAAAARAGQLFQVFDASPWPRVRQAAGDALYVRAPVLRVVEPARLCWVSGHLSSAVSGAVWAQEWSHLPALEQVTRDGGSGLAKGVALVNAQRQAQGQPVVVDQGDPGHALRGGSAGLRHVEAQARPALTEAEAAQQAETACARQGQSQHKAGTAAAAAWRRAAKALATWGQRERAWAQTQAALRRFTPAGELNTRQRAQAVLAQT